MYKRQRRGTDIPYIDATAPRRFGTDDPSSYPTFLPQGGIGGTGPQPEDELFGVMPWEREAFSTVEADPSQLDSAFMAANGAARSAIASFAISTCVVASVVV